MDHPRLPPAVNNGVDVRMQYTLSQACLGRELRTRDAANLADLRRVVSEDLGPFASPLLQAVWAWILAPRREGRQAQAASRFGVGTSTFMSRLFRAGVSSPALWRRRVNVVRVAMLAEDSPTTWPLLADVLSASSPQSLNRQVLATGGKGLPALRAPGAAVAALTWFRQQLVVERAAWHALDARHAARDAEATVQMVAGQALRP